MQCVIVDYGMGNLGSIANMLKKLGYRSSVTSDPTMIAEASGLILPGVGSFDRGMENLQSRNLIDILNQRIIDDRIPVLGICLGAQLIMSESEEGHLKGLNWISGKVKKFNFEGKGTEKKVPHMGWNEMTQSRNSDLWDKMPDPARFYFVHTYFIEPDHTEDILGTTDYGCSFASAVGRKNIWGVQFHPEKSHQYGLRLLKNFMNIVDGKRPC